MSNSSKPAIASGSEDESDSTGGVPITTNTELRKVSINAPAAGVIVGIGGLNVYFSASGSLYCIVNNGPTIPSPGLRMYSNSTDADFRTMSQTRAFPVTGPGIVTIYLLCTVQSGAPLPFNAGLVAFFVPQNQGIIAESSDNKASAVTGKSLSNQ